MERQAIFGDKNMKKCHSTVILYIKVITPDQVLFFFQPISRYFLISPIKGMLWYSLEVPHQSASNEYPQLMFAFRNKKNILWRNKKNISARALLMSTHTIRFMEK